MQYVLYIDEIIQGMRHGVYKPGDRFRNENDVKFVVVPSPVVGKTDKVRLVYASDLNKSPALTASNTHGGWKYLGNEFEKEMLIEEIEEELGYKIKILKDKTQ